MGIGKTLGTAVAITYVLATSGCWKNKDVVQPVQAQSAKVEASYDGRTFHSAKDLANAYYEALSTDNRELFDQVARLMPPEERDRKWAIMQRSLDRKGVEELVLDRVLDDVYRNPRPGEAPRRIDTNFVIYFKDGKVDRKNNGEIYYAQDSDGLAVMARRPRKKRK